MYTIPNEYFIRLHHVRPRFKDDIEDVLIYMAGEIAELPELPHKEFAERLNEAIYRYPGNLIKKKKTIDNWRTEISALFGFVVNTAKTTKAGRRAKDLFINQDLIESFKVFLYTFQYPGAHIKSHKILEMIEAGVKFKPAQSILRVIKAGENSTGKRVGLSKVEICHCMFNDLRCVRDGEDPLITWRRIQKNRESYVEYDSKGDVIRYAGDIVDYMEIANLLVTYDNKIYYINNLESEAVLKFINSTEWFDKYDSMIENRSATLNEIKQYEEKWFEYVNRDLSKTDFSTDILAFISKNSEEYENLKTLSIDLFFNKLSTERNISTKDIGDMGENLIHGHECQRIKNGGRQDLISLIKKIPTQFAVGYDIQSVELDERKRYIEVKTTISSKPLHFNKIHLTTNEWNTASSMKDRYFVYRLSISKNEKKLYILQDPVALYKNDIIEMNPKNGAEITFKTEFAGNFEELLAWTI